MTLDYSYEKQLELLASPAPGEERLVALKYVVHLVADVHQPLHGGFADDRGGNGFQISWKSLERGSNLHALWDSGLKVPLVVRFPAKFQPLAPTAPGTPPAEVKAVQFTGTKALPWRGS